MDENQAVLRALDPIVRSWPRPVINAPGRIARLSRDGVCALLRAAPRLAVPPTARLGRRRLVAIGRGETAINSMLDGGSFPIIARPIGSHAGNGLAKLDDAAALGDYLSERPEGEFYVAPFVDYRGADGLFCKYRIVFIDGRPYASHMALSEHWMVHYLNAGMTESGEKRAREASFMARFDDDFVPRHKAALEALAARVDLDYFALDCGETHDGRLLVFEVDVAMIVHAMDPPDLYPYKQVQMRKVFAAFHAMLLKAAAFDDAREDAASAA